MYHIRTKLCFRRFSVKISNWFHPKYSSIYVWRRIKAFVNEIDCRTGAWFPQSSMHDWVRILEFGSAGARYEAAFLKLLVQTRNAGEKKKKGKLNTIKKSRLKASISI